MLRIRIGGEAGRGRSTDRKNVRNRFWNSRMRRMC